MLVEVVISRIRPRELPCHKTSFSVMLKYITLFAALSAAVLAQDSLMDDLLEQEMQVWPAAIQPSRLVLDRRVLPAPEKAFLCVSFRSVRPRHSRFMHHATT